MYKGVFAGKLASEQKKRVLILGESHHGNPTVWKQENKTTKDVVLSYLKKYHGGQSDPNYAFFEKIVNSFGFDPKKYREEFWSKVYFGNYVDVLCGSRDSKAKREIKKQKEKDDIYNQELFEFINDKEIDVVFCFSKLVWKNLPVEIPYQQKAESAYIKSCIYEAEKGFGNIPTLKKPLKVYGMRHPTSWGYSPKNYQEVLHNALEEILK